MSFASWLTETELFDDLDLKERKHHPYAEPIHSRPSLEYLEERTLLDASSGLIGGTSGNLNFNSNFNLASNGAILPTPQSTPNTTAVTPNVFPSAASGTALAVSSSFLSQGQLNSQFRDFAINSQGAGFRLDLNTQVGVLNGAFGFGSGTQPNAPWKPNAYNLGLANRQPDYSTQTDNGFGSAQPWSRQWSSPVAQSHQNDQNRLVDEEDQLHFLNKDEQETEEPEQLTARHTMSQEEQPPQHWLGLDFGDKGDEMQALIEQQAAEKKSPVEGAVPASEAIPDPLLLSTLAPAQMAALVAGLPGMPAAEGGEAGAESGAVVEAAPE